MQHARVVYSDATHCQCVVDNLYVLYTGGAASSENVEQLCKHFDRFASSSNGSVACCIVTAVGTSPPGEDDRAKIANVMTKHADKLDALAFVLRAKGFRGSIIRSVVAGIFLLPNPGYPTKVFENTKEASSWLARKTTKAEREVELALRFAVDRFEQGNTINL